MISRGVMKHEFQHSDEPTWCIHCGTFAHNCRPDGDCDATELSRFDTRKPGVYERMEREIFGSTEEL